MTTFARVDGGIVREIIVADALPPFTPEITAQFHAAPDGIAEGWTFDGTTFAAPAPPAPPRRAVLKSVILSRLTDAQLAAAIAAMSQRQQEQWRSPDQPTVFADDQVVIGLVKAIGADPNVVLA
jgi:hypothetical protein